MAQKRFSKIVFAEAYTEFILNFDNGILLENSFCLEHFVKLLDKLLMSLAVLLTIEVP